MWTIFYNYYLNTIQDNERSVKQIVDVFNEMDLWRDTVIVFTADHGEMGGSHGGLKGKGPFVYEQNAHVPLVVAHPAGPARCAVRRAHEPSRPGAHLRRPDGTAGNAATRGRESAAGPRLLAVARRAASRRARGAPGRALQLHGPCDGRWRVSQERHELSDARTRRPSRRSVKRTSRSAGCSRLRSTGATSSAATTPRRRSTRR